MTTYYVLILLLIGVDGNDIEKIEFTTLAKCESTKKHLDKIAHTRDRRRYTLVFSDCIEK